MSTRIYEIIETLKEGQEVIIVLRDGQQMCGLYRGIDGEQLLLKSKSGNAPILGWNISDIEDIVSDDNEPAGDVVKAEFVDLKTGRKVSITLDVTEEECKATIRFIPTAHRDDKGAYIFYANLFIESLSKQPTTMLTKEIRPIISHDKKRVIGVLVEYKLFRILLYKKRMYTPSLHGLTDWEFDYRI